MPVEGRLDSEAVGEAVCVPVDTPLVPELVEEPVDTAVVVTGNAVEFSNFAIFRPHIELWWCCISGGRVHEPRRHGLRRKTRHLYRTTMPCGHCTPYTRCCSFARVSN